MVRSMTVTQGSLRTASQKTRSPRPRVDTPCAAPEEDVGDRRWTNHVQQTLPLTFQPEAESAPRSLCAPPDKGPSLRPMRQAGHHGIGAYPAAPRLVGAPTKMNARAARRRGKPVS
jgi:hypothetical protein